MTELVLRLRHTRRQLPRIPTWRARLRYIYWAHIRCYELELCLKCGRPYYEQIGPTWWHAEDALWLAVEGGPGGLRCPRCFTEDCAAVGIKVFWQPVVEGPSRDH